MKCAYCESPLIFFTVMPEISKDVAWCSHIITEIGNKFSLYHYQCAEADPLAWYEVFKQMIDESEKV